MLKPPITENQDTPARGPITLISAAEAGTTNPSQGAEPPMTDKIEKTDEEWRSELTPEQYRVLRQKGTEPAFQGEYWASKTPGKFHCAGCGEELFSSEAKFDSGSGWPSFDRPLNEASVEKHADTTHGMIRTEVICHKCGGHLGHVFPDGPPTTGLRYCINSAAVKLDQKAKG
jgi:peptide-methionine (R)-S-oxide reductase